MCANTPAKTGGFRYQTPKSINIFLSKAAHFSGRAARVCSRCVFSCRPTRGTVPFDSCLRLFRPVAGVLPYLSALGLRVSFPLTVLQAFLRGEAFDRRSSRARLPMANSRARLMCNLVILYIDKAIYRCYNDNAVFFALFRLRVPPYTERTWPELPKALRA